MANLSKVIYINEEDYSTLVGGDTITKNGTTYSYDSTALYVIKNVGPPEYANTAGYANSAGRATGDSSGNDIRETYATKTELAEKISIYYYNTVTEMESSSNHSMGDIAFDYGKKDFYIFDSTNGIWKKIIDVDDISTQYIQISKEDMTVYPGDSDLLTIEKNTISDVLINGEFRRDVVIQFNPYLPGESGYNSNYYPVQVHLCPPFYKTSSEWSTMVTWSDCTYVGEIVWRDIIHTFSIDFNLDEGNITSYSVYYKSQDVPNKVPVLSGYASNPGLPITGDSLGEAFGKLNYNILENEEITSKALIDLNNKINTNTGIEGIVYQELVNLKTLGKLIPGKFYRITDYTCTTTQTDTQSAGHTFDVIVLALSESVLSEEAWAMQHSGDTYFANSNLAAWELKYCLDNDTTRFSWADATNGKGVIYWMKDEWNNECSYDFKNIQFRAAINTGTGLFSSFTNVGGVFLYTFTWLTQQNEPQDCSTIFPNSASSNVGKVYNNNIKNTTYDLYQYYLPFNIFYASYIDSYYFGGIRGNSIGKDCDHVVIRAKGTDITNNIVIGNNCNSIRVSGTNILVGNNCSNITTGTRFDDIIIGNDCTNITLAHPADSAKSLYYQHIIIESHVENLQLYPESTPSYNTKFKNILIQSGISGESSNNRKYIYTSVDNDFLTTYKPANSVEISV